MKAALRWTLGKSLKHQKVKHWSAEKGEAREELLQSTGKCSSVFPLLLLVIGVSDGSSDQDCKCRDIHPTAGKCYTCKDKDGCSKLKNIYDSRVYLNPKEIYQGDDTKFPRCSEISPPGDNCTVCLDLSSSSINIFCSEHIGEIDLEGSNAQYIGTFSLKCVKLQPPGPTSQPSVSLSNVSPHPNVHDSTRRGLISSSGEHSTVNAHLGLICSFVFLIVLAALGISYHCYKKRGFQSVNSGL
ncbi:uncharacterized protein [Pseudochaenichthys georgianus]|uniref:uncharacterized protein isoform X2 n=1 Tax=Pseudochaenichthys georgianus TaxID=52239 RepID=UPI00146E667E|nr:uncharacterized protein LOC117461347 isoform X2 [Pseudochaenichthys georgianus]